MSFKRCTPHHNRTCRYMYFILLFLLDVADLVSDWLFYADVSVAEKGLVYGPPAKSAIHALLAFSIIGTLTFIFESANLWYELFRCNPWLDSDLVSAVTIWTEDLPQIAINVYIAYCREDPISVFQLSKAAVVLLSLLIRFIICCVKYCNKKALEETNGHTASSKRHVAYRVFIMLGLIINAGCAVVVFLFTQTQRTDSGRIKLPIPDNLIDEKYYNDQRYFQNVSIFLHSPELDPSTLTHTHWLHIMSINDIRDHKDSRLRYKIVTERSSLNVNVALYKGDVSQWQLVECHRKDLSSGNITSSGSSSSGSCPTSPSKTIFITFAFIPPSFIFKKFIFGDIQYNAKVSENGFCTDVDAQVINPNTASLHYYRTNVSATAGSRLYVDDGTQLEDVAEVWKTGFGECESSGSMTPNLDTGIDVTCS